MRSNQLSYPAIVSRLRVQRYDFYLNLQNISFFFLLFCVFWYKMIGLEMIIEKSWFFMNERMWFTIRLLCCLCDSRDYKNAK